MWGVWGGTLYLGRFVSMAMQTVNSKFLDSDPFAIAVRAIAEHGDVQSAKAMLLVLGLENAPINFNNLRSQFLDVWLPKSGVVKQDYFDLLCELVELGNKFPFHKDIESVAQLLTYQYIRQDELARLERLVVAGANISWGLDGEVSPLCYVASLGKIKALLMLMKTGGANINPPEFTQELPLICAVKEGRVEMVEFLLKRGADPEAMNHECDNALIWALRYNYMNISTLLENSIKSKAACANL